MRRIKDKLSDKIHHSHSTDSYTYSNVPSTEHNFSSEPQHFSSSYDGSATNNATETNVLKTENDRKKSPKEVLLHAIAFPLKAVGKLVFVSRSRGGAYEPVLSRPPKNEAEPRDENHMV